MILVQQESHTHVPKFVGPLELYTPICCPWLLAPKVALFVIVGDWYQDQFVLGNGPSMNALVPYLRH